MPGDAFLPTTFGALIAAGVLEIGDGYRARNEELGGQGPIFLRAGHVADTHIDFTGAERFLSDYEPKVRPKMSRPGDAVVTTKGNSTGRTAFVTELMPPFVYSPHLSYWRSRDPARLASGFLRFWSRGEEFRIQLEAMKVSTDMAPYLSLADQRRLRITLPAIRVQEAIGQILGALDDKIELNRRLNETLETIARALFRSWFVDFDDVPKERLTECECGHVPPGWTREPLDSIAHFLNGLALQRYPPSGDDVLPVIKIAQLKANHTVGADLASASIPQEYIVADGDLVFSWSGSLDVRLWCGGPGALNQHLFKVTSRQYPKWFCHQWLCHYLPAFRQIAADKATTMGHIQRHHLSQVLVRVPPPQRLQAIDDTLRPMTSAVIANAVQSRTLTALRDAILPKLLSGELRLKDAERQAEQVL